MEENEFIPKSEQKIEQPINSGKSKKDDKKEKNISTKDKQTILDKIDKQKVKVITGSFLSLLAI